MMGKNKKKKFWLHGRYFDSFEDMLLFESKWRDSPCDLESYRKFLDQRFEAAKLNVAINPEITNRTIFMMLRMNTDWVKEGKNA